MVGNESEAALSLKNPSKWIRYASIGLVYCLVGLMTGLILAAFGLSLVRMTISCMLIGAIAGIVVAYSAG
jgi:hypothetical protein